LARLKDKYRSEVVKGLQQKFGYKNVMEIPRLEKIVVNMGLGDCKDNAKAMEVALNVGAKVTLRGDRMYEFADKVISIVLPRVRDFRGVSDKAFDGRGNYALGVREQLIFPEIEYDKVEKIRGMEMIFVTTAKTDEEAKELLRQLGMPFRYA
jgi:large subunit ribosomal protein L5